MNSDHQDKVAQFTAITGANPSIAQSLLESTSWNIEEAVGLYYGASADPEHDHDEDYDADEPVNQRASQPSSSQAAPPSGSSSRRTPGQQRPKQMTLQDLQRGGDDEEEEDNNQDMFAGGEKSGLAVQNPGDRNNPLSHFENIMRQARENRPRPREPGEDEEEEQQPTRRSYFTGRAQTLGGDDAPSQVVEDPTAAAPSRQRLPRVTRTLHLWADGVSIDDGPLFRFDDPANADIVEQINRGRAPVSMLDVQPGQEVDLNLAPHKGENYVQPKKKYQPFSGQGQRLGSPTPGIRPASSATEASSLSSSVSHAPAAATIPQSQGQAQMTIDESAPTIQLQIRLGDGTQLRSRFNTTHTIGDVYEFVNRASPASTQRRYALMTTFPSKELSDKAQVLGEMAEYKRGGVIVQKWV